MKSKISFYVLILLSIPSTIAQSYIGFTADNYSGVHGLLLNPASIVDSNFRTDINLASVSAFAGSDYFSLDVADAIDNIQGDGFSFDDEVERNPKEDNQFFMNADVVGPSFMFNLNRKSSIGLITRVRVFMNFNNLNGELFEALEDDFDLGQDLDFELRDFNGTVHAWAEVGLSYGRILMDRDGNFLKAGLTVKYLQGAGATYYNAPSVNGFYNAGTEELSTTGTLSYGTSNEFNGDDIDFSNLSSGFGADLGIIYELRPAAGIAEDGKSLRNDYILKLGVSVTDIGSISYSESETTSYDLNNTVSRTEFDEEDLEDVLEVNYNGQKKLVDSKVNLPTALNIQADYRFKKRLFLALQGSLSMTGKDADRTNRILNSVTAIPRYQAKWLSFYLPVGIRQYDGFAMGTGLRFGPLYVGSGSVISNLISDSSQTTDIYAGLKIPIYR